MIENDCSSCRWSYSVNDNCSCDENKFAPKPQCALNVFTEWSPRSCGFCKHFNEIQTSIRGKCSKYKFNIPRDFIEKGCDHFKNRTEPPKKVERVINCVGCRHHSEVNNYFVCPYGEFGSSKCIKKGWEATTCGSCKNLILEFPKYDLGVKSNFYNCKKYGDHMSFAKNCISRCKHFSNRIEPKKVEPKVKFECNNCRFHWKVNKEEKSDEYNSNYNCYYVAGFCSEGDKWEARACGHCKHYNTQSKFFNCPKLGGMIIFKKQILNCEHFQNRVPSVEVKKNGCGTCERYINSKCELHKGFSIAMCISKGLKDWKFKVKKKPATCKGCSSLDPHIISRCRRLNVYIGWHWKACQLKNVPLEKTIPVNKVIPIPDDLDIRTATPNEINKYLQEPKKRKRIKDPNELLQRCGGCFHYDLKNVGFFCNKFNKKILQSKTFERWMYESKKCQHYSKKRNTIPYMRFPETIRDDFIVGFDPSFIDPYMMDHLAVSLNKKPNKQKEVVKKMVNVKEEIKEMEDQIKKIEEERLKVNQLYKKQISHKIFWNSEFKKSFLKYLKKQKISKRDLRDIKKIRRSLHDGCFIYRNKRLELIETLAKYYRAIKLLNFLIEYHDKFLHGSINRKLCKLTKCSKVCKKCGATLEKEGKFCKYCGEAIK